MRYMYLIERITDSEDYPIGTILWAESPCIYWRIIRRMEYQEYLEYRKYNTDYPEILHNYTEVKQ